MTPKIKKRADGRYQKQITLHDGLTGRSFRKTVYASTLYELETKVARIRSEYEGMNRLTMTVGQFIEYYLKCRQATEGNTKTLATYSQLYRLHIATAPICRIRLDRLNVACCNEFFMNFMPIKKGTDGGRTKQMLYVFLHIALKQAWRERMIKENPLDFVTKPKHRAKQRDILEPEEFELLIQHTPTLPMQRLFRFARNTGLRRGEICGLQLKHIEGDTVHVVQAAKKVNKEKFIGETKTLPSIRDVLIPPHIQQLVEEQKKHLETLAKRYRHKLTGEDYLFPGENFGLMAPDSVSRAFTRARKEAGLPDTMSFHSLRATVATYLAEHDVNVKSIQMKLGHSTPTMTLTRYIKSTARMQAGLMPLLEDL